MKTSSLRLRPLATAILGTFIASLAPSLNAQTTATTDPVGFITVNYTGNADSFAYIPFKRTPEYAGAVVTPSGATTNTLTIAGTPNFAANQFVYVPPVPPAASTQPKTYYVLFTSGPKNGMYYTITSNTSNVLTLNTAGDDVSGTSGATFQIIPYDTLNSIFPGGQGVNGSPGHGGAQRQTEILIPDNVNPGIDLAVAKTYYYYTGTAGSGPGWRLLGGGTGNIVNDDPLFPDNSFIVRNNVATATAVTYMGTVHMGNVSTYISDPGVQQDNAVALPIASNLTLAQTKLFESGAFAGSAGHGGGARRDQLLVWDNAVSGRDKAADRTYYYYTGSVAPGPGWRLLGVTGTIADTDVVLTPTSGIAIRKYSTGTPSSVLWTFKPPYVP